MCFSSSLSGNVASDTTLLAKFQRHHASHSCFDTSLIEPTFTITHYAGKVIYDIKVLYLLSFVETPRKFIIAELSIRKLGSSSVL